MSIIFPVAGRYAGAYTPAAGAASALGVLTDTGFELSVSIKGQEINETDAYGASLVDGIYRGADWRLRYRCKEYGSNNLVALWPWGKGAQSLSPLMGVIGRRWSDVAGAMVLTATAGTPAAANPATLTASQAIISPNVNLTLDFTSKVREVPVEQCLLPYDVGGGSIGWFTTT